MTVTVTVFGMLREHLPAGAAGNRAVLEIPDGSSVSDVADALGIPEKAVFAVLVDGARGDRSSVVPPSSEVTLMPPFTGGSHGT